MREVAASRCADLLAQTRLGASIWRRAVVFAMDALLCILVGMHRPRKAAPRRSAASSNRKRPRNAATARRVKFHYEQTDRGQKSIWAFLHSSGAAFVGRGDSPSFFRRTSSAPLQSVDTTRQHLSFPSCSSAHCRLSMAASSPRRDTSLGSMRQLEGVRRSQMHSSRQPNASGLPRSVLLFLKSGATCKHRTARLQLPGKSGAPVAHFSA